MRRQPWEYFSSVRSTSFAPELVGAAQTVSPEQLVVMADYRRDERITACNGHDPIRIALAYAQEELGYDASQQIIRVKDKTTYAALQRNQCVNIFGLAYRPDAPFLLHRTLADIVIGAAVHLYQSQRWTTVLYDGLRTVEGAFNLYNLATDEDLASGLLALPGQSAHNKGMAVDSMMEDENGHEIDMGGHFDHLDMITNSRVYAGDKISSAAKKNRIIRETAFLRSAFTQDLLVAPLRPEFWDDRLPENRADLWRVLDSAARCMGISLLTPEDELLRKTDRAAFHAKWENWSYDDFLIRWHDVFKGREKEVEKLFGVVTPPSKEKLEFYHGNFHPIYDRDLVASGKNLTRLTAF